MRSNLHFRKHKRFEPHVLVTSLIFKCIHVCESSKYCFFGRKEIILNACRTFQLFNRQIYRISKQCPGIVCISYFFFHKQVFNPKSKGCRILTARRLLTNPVLLVSGVRKKKTNRQQRGKGLKSIEKFNNLLALIPPVFSQTNCKKS